MEIKTLSHRSVSQEEEGGRLTERGVFRAHKEESVDRQQGGDDQEDDHAGFSKGVVEFYVIRVGTGEVRGSSDP